MAVFVFINNKAHRRIFNKKKNPISFRNNKK